MYTAAIIAALLVPVGMWFYDRIEYRQEVRKYGKRLADEIRRHNY